MSAAQQINPDVSAMSGIASELEPSTCLILVGDSHIGIVEGFESARGVSFWA